MKITREFYEWEGDMFEVIKVLNEAAYPNSDKVKEILGADKVLRKGEDLFYLKKVEEAIIVTD